MTFTCTPDLLTHGPLATAEAGGSVRTRAPSYLIEGQVVDFGVTGEAPLTVLQTSISGLPEAGDAMIGTSGTSPWGTSNLFVIGRTCRMETPAVAIVDVSWQQFETSLNNPDGSGTTHSVGTKTVTTSTDRSGQPLSVVYGLGITATSPEEIAAAGSHQQPTVTVMDAEPVYSTELVVSIPANIEPSDVTAYYVGKVNSGEWRGLPENSWLCTAATPRPLNPFTSSPSIFGFLRYVYSFRFVASTYGKGWNPTIEWIDPTTRMPPANLQEGFGRKLVEWYEAADFSQEPGTIAQTLRP